MNCRYIMLTDRSENNEVKNLLWKYFGWIFFFRVMLQMQIMVCWETIGTEQALCQAHRPVILWKISQSDRTKRMHYLTCYTVTWYFTYTGKERRSTRINITYKIKALSKNVTPLNRALSRLYNFFIKLFSTLHF